MPSASSVAAACSQMNELLLLEPNTELFLGSLPTATESAWLAGFIDGEGTIGLAASKRTRIISTYLVIPNTNLDNMARVRVLLSALLGRDVRVAKGATKERRPIYVIAIQNQPDIKCVLEHIRRWLIGKAPQADLMLEYIRIAPGQRGQRYTDAHYELVNRMHVLNKRYAPGTWRLRDEAQDSGAPSTKTPNERPADTIKRWWRLRFDV
jgi:hypothetical protein